MFYKPGKTYFSFSSDEYYQMYMLKNSMDPLLLIELFVSLLFERRIILRSTSLGTLTDVCSAIESLLYPFKVSVKGLAHEIRYKQYNIYYDSKN